MGYTLWIGSRKKNESTNERTIQEHDKAKVLQAMLKAGSNKAEAQALLKKHYAYVDKKYRDAPASKKAEIIVTLAGTASEAKINERSESYREAELKKVAQMTDRNQHLEARLFIAKKGGYEKHRKAYLALIDLQDALGHTPRGAEQVRSDLDKDLKKYLSKDVDNWEEVWKSLMEKRMSAKFELLYRRILEADKMKKSELKQMIREILEEDLVTGSKRNGSISEKDKDGKHPPCGTSGDNEDMLNAFLKQLPTK